MPARYESVAPIAHGGMARLELARMRGAHGFEKWVAVKRILPQWADEPEFVAMFMDEARLVAQLDHPNIVHVHDFAQDDDGLYIAMEYIHGPSLRGILEALRKRDESMPLRHAASIGVGIAAGLAHAHTRVGTDGGPLSIIHRDVSPTNVLVTYEGVVKLVDFGIAKAQSNQHRTTGTTRKGKVAYMSPEQCKARPLDARSDIFALGALLYEMVTGVRAFDADDELGVMNAIVNHDVVPPSRHRPDLPAAFEAIIVQALQRDPDARPASAREVERALEELDLRLSRADLGEWVTQIVGHKPLPWAGLSEVAPESVEPSVPPAPATAVRAVSGAPSRRRWGTWAAIGAAAVGIAIVGMQWAGDEARSEVPTNAATGSADAKEESVAASTPDRGAAVPPVEADASEAADRTAEREPVEAAPESDDTPADPPAASAKPRVKRKRVRKPDASASTPSKPTEGFDPNGLAPRRRAD